MADSPEQGTPRGTEGSSENGSGLAGPKGGGEVMNQTHPSNGGGAPPKAPGNSGQGERSTEGM